MANVDSRSRSGNSGKNTDWSELIFWAILAIIFFGLLTALPNALEERLGVEVSLLSFLEQERDLTSDTPIGSRVISTKDAQVRNEPNARDALFVADGTKGTVVGGPVLFGDTLWWEVRFEDGTTGWVLERDIAIDINDDRKTLNDSTPSGSKTLNSRENEVRSAPGGGNVLGHKEKGEQGTVVSGPEIIFSDRWWKISYEDGTTGWVKQDGLLIDTDRNIRAVKINTPLGTKIKSIQSGEVFNRPNGDILRLLREGELGIIEGGPAHIGNQRWWSIDFEEDIDGWVREERIAKLFSLRESARSIRSSFIIIAYIYSIVLLVALGYIIMNLRTVIAAERDKYRPISVIPHEETRQIRNNRWDRVLEHLHSENPNEWRLAVIEADVMLDEMVTSFGHVGDTLGEKLQNIEISDFLTLNQAWEAHKVRNVIAHAGSEFVLTEREAQRIIGLYEQVFREFHLI